MVYLTLIKQTLKTEIWATKILFFLKKELKIKKKLPLFVILSILCLSVLLIINSPVCWAIAFIIILIKAIIEYRYLLYVLKEIEKQYFDAHWTYSDIEFKLSILNNTSNLHLQEVSNGNSFVYIWDKAKYIVLLKTIIILLYEDDSFLVISEKNMETKEAYQELVSLVFDKNLNIITPYTAKFIHE